jgi:hypothetical protein
VGSIASTKPRLSLQSLHSSTPSRLSTGRCTTMAVTLKRKRGAVSYKEPSSDDFLDSSDHEHTTRLKRTGPTRRSTRHSQTNDEASSESEHVSPEPAPARKRQVGSRSSRSHGRQRISYKDVSSDEEEEEEDPDADFEMEGNEFAPVRPKRSRQTVPRCPHSSKAQKTTGKSRRKATIGAPLKPNQDAPAERRVANIPTDGHKPVCRPTVLRTRPYN